MKNRLTQGLGFCALAALSFASCKKDEVQATLASNDTPTLTASTNTVALTQINGSNTAITYTWAPLKSFTWTGVDHPYNPSVTYSIQFDKAGNNFASPTSISAGNGPTTVVTVADLDAALLALGVAPGKATNIETRLQASYAANAPLYSATVPLAATAYAFCPQPKKAWSVIGPAGPGWSDDFTMTYDCDAKTFTYVGPLKADEFKFRFGKHWTTNLGGTGPTVPLAPNGSNLKVGAAGSYTVTLYNAADSTKLGSAYFTIK